MQERSELAKRHGADHRAFWDIPEHPDDPAWVARRRLSAALKRLNDLAVETDGPAAAIDAIAASLEAAGEALAAQPALPTAAAWRSGRFQRERQAFADRNPLAGRCNPVSPPMEMTWDGRRLRSEVTFSATHGGAPGIAHGCCSPGASPRRWGRA